MAGQKYSVLVVDDSKQVRFVTATLLEKLGYEVYAAENGKEGIATAVVKKPDIILLDIMMPEIDGFKVCQMLKGREETCDIPIIMVTAKNNRKDILRAKELGADNYIIKPATAKIIHEKVCAELAKRGKVVEGYETQATEQLSREVEKPADPNDPAQAIDRLLRKTKELLALPFAVNRALKVSGDNASGAQELAKIISSDVAITAMVLKKANSAFYGAKKRIVDAQEAIVRIGFSQTKSVVVGLSIIQLFNTQQKARQFNRLEFWEHSLAVALIAKRLGKAAGIDEQDAFMAGLLHDIGKVILDENMPDEFEAAISKSKSEQQPLYAAERENLRFTHLDVGAAILDKWQMPPSVIEAARSHNNFRACTSPDETIRTLVRVVYHANQFAKVFDLGNASDLYLVQLEPEDLAFLRLEKGLPDDFRSGIMAELDDFRAFLGIESRNAVPPVEKKQVVLFDESNTPLNVHAEFLRVRDYDVFPFRLLKDILTEGREDPLLILDMAKDLLEEKDWIRVSQMAKERRLLAITTPALINKFKSLGMEQSVLTFTRPVDSHVLFDAVVKNIGGPYEHK